MKILHTSYHSHRDVCRLTPFNKTFLRNSKTIHPEAEGLEPPQTAQSGVDSFLTYFYFIEIFKALPPQRDPDADDILDNIPAAFKDTFYGVLRAAAEDARKTTPPSRRTERDANNTDGPIVPPLPQNEKLNYFPGNTKAEWNALLNSLPVPAAQQSAFYKRCVSAKILPGHTNGALDAARVRAAWAAHQS